MVLLGDSAHAVTGNLGQGANMALESVSVFSRVLDECRGDLDKALPAFTHKRRGDVHALQELEVMQVGVRGGGGGYALLLLEVMQVGVQGGGGLCLAAAGGHAGGCAGRGGLCLAAAGGHAGR